MIPSYAELHCLSNFSFLRGASHPEELVQRAQALGYAALAITDECSLAGAVRAHLAAKESRLPLLIGSEMTLDNGTKIVLLVTDRASYGNLAQLITRGRRSAAKGSYALTRDDDTAFAEGLLALWVPPDAALRKLRSETIFCEAEKLGSETNIGELDHIAEESLEKSSLTLISTARWVAATFPGRA